MDPDCSQDAAREARRLIDVDRRWWDTVSTGSADLVRRSFAAGYHLVVTGVGEELPKRPDFDRESASRPVLDDSTGLDHGDVVGALRGPESMSDQDARPSPQQPLRRGDDLRLGQRVHPGRRLVEHDHPYVAHDEPGERDELLFPRRQDRPRGTQQRIEACRKPGHPRTQTELVDRRLDVGTLDRREHRDVLGQRAGDDLCPLADEADGGTKVVEFEVEHVDPCEEHGAGRRVDCTHEERGECRLARAAPADERQRRPRRNDHRDAVERERTLGVGEVQIAELDRGGSVGDRTSACRLVRRRHQRPETHQRADARLQIGKVMRDLIDLTDEGDRDGEQRDEHGGRLEAAGDEHHAGDRHDRQEAVEEQARATHDRRFDRDHVVHPRVHDRREFRTTADEIRLAEAGAQIVACGDALLHRCGVVGPSCFLGHLAQRQQTEEWAHHDEHGERRGRQQHPGRPPGEPGDEQQRHRDERESDDAPRAHPQQRAQFVRVVVDPVEDLADGLFGQRRHGLTHHRVEQVGAQLPLGSIDHTAPDHPAHGVEHGGTHQTEGEQPHVDPARALCETSDEDCAERLCCGGHRCECNRDLGRPSAESRPTDRSAGAVLAGSDAPVRRCRCHGRGFGGRRDRHATTVGGLLVAPRRGFRRPVRRRWRRASRRRRSTGRSNERRPRRSTRPTVRRCRWCGPCVRVAGR